MTTAFDSVPLNDIQIEQVNTLREIAKHLADLIVLLSPKSREQSLALTKLEENIMCDNKAISRRVS